MKTIPMSEYPKDFFYHRTSAEIYRPYIESCGNISTFDIWNNPQYAWKKWLLGNRVHIVKYERTDIEPNIDILKQWCSSHENVLSKYMQLGSGSVFLNNSNLYNW